VAILGLSFKAGTDDLRERPVVDLIRSLWQDGIDTVVYDPDINPETMLASNREYLERQLPQIKDIIRPDIAETLRMSEAVVVNQNRPELRNALNDWDGHIAVIDFVRLNEGRTLPRVSKYRWLSC
jgi:GDP-mannose 6-dehydrogenase